MEKEKGLKGLAVEPKKLSLIHISSRSGLCLSSGRRRQGRPTRFLPSAKRCQEPTRFCIQARKDSAGYGLSLIHICIL